MGRMTSALLAMLRAALMSAGAACPQERQANSASPQLKPRASSEVLGDEPLTPELAWAIGLFEGEGSPRFLCTLRLQGLTFGRVPG